MCSLIANLPAFFCVFFRFESILKIEWWRVREYGFCSSVILLLYAPIQRRKETIFHRFHKLDSALMDSPCAKFWCLSLSPSVCVCFGHKLYPSSRYLLRIAYKNRFKSVNRPFVSLFRCDNRKKTIEYIVQMFVLNFTLVPFSVSLEQHKKRALLSHVSLSVCVSLFVSLFPITKVNRMREAIKQRRYFVFYVCVPSAHPSHKHRRHTRSHKHKHTYNHMIVQNYPNHARRSAYTQLSAVLWLCGGDGGG